MKTLKELAEILHGELNNVEYSDIIIDEVTGLDAAFQHQLEHAITFAENEKLLGEVEKAGFAAVLLPSGPSRTSASAWARPLPRPWNFFIRPAFMRPASILVPLFLSRQR